MLKAMRRPRLSVRSRLTALYGGLFVISGALVLSIAGGLAASRTSAVAVQPSPGTPNSQLHRAEAEIRALRALVAAQSQAQSAIPHQLIVASFVALAVTALLSIGLGWLMAGRALRPVRQMTATAQRISADSLDERLAMKGPNDELKELGDTIDGLLTRLETAFSAQRRFVANASHELRTPLTTMRASLDVALAKPEPAPPQTVALAGRLRTELDRIDTLLEGLLVLARAQHGDLPGLAVLPLDYLVSATLTDRAQAIAARRLTVRTEAGPGGAWVVGSQALLHRLVENLVDNAIGHNVDGGWITAYTSADDVLALLVIENGGTAFSPEQAAGLAQPFRRLGADRTGSDQGSGLGLSIVAAIAEAHGGRLGLRARLGGGLSVSVELPVARLTSVYSAAAAWPVFAGSAGGGSAGGGSAGGRV
jgi:signal transduction histidine kinase